MDSIFTLNARGNVMFEVIRHSFALNPKQVRHQILNIHSELTRVLARKSIAYKDLRGALVPAIDRHEVALVFDSQEIESDWYGQEVICRLIPKLDKRVSCSILCGDLIHKDQEFIYKLLCNHLVTAREFEFVHGTLLYCVYINNLTQEMVNNLSAALSDYRPYVGCIRATYSSIAKTYLSTILVGAFIKHRQKIIMGHEDDRSNEEDVNMLRYPFEEMGYQCVSLQGSLYGAFLSYKIERQVFPGFESDIQFSLNSISSTIVPLAAMGVRVEEAKLDYIKRAKVDSLERAGLTDIDSATLEKLIQSKIANNYIYNMVHLIEHRVTKFNVMIEVGLYNKSSRLMVSLEYLPEKTTLRLITMF